MRVLLLCLALVFCGDVVRAQAPPSSTAQVASQADRQTLLASRDRLWEVAQVERKRGEVIKALAAAEEMLAIERRAFGELHEEVLGSVEWIAEALEEFQVFALALARRAEALQIATALYGGDDWRVTDARLAQAWVGVLVALSAADRERLTMASQQAVRAEQLVRTRQFREAVPAAEEALAIRRAVLGGRDPATLSSVNNLGRLYDWLGDSVRAEALHQEALAGFRAVLGDRHPNTAASLNNLGVHYRSRGDAARAEPLYQEALAIRRAVFGDRHSATAQSLNNLGTLYLSQGDTVRAQPLYQDALAIRRAVLGDRHPDTVDSLNNLGGLYIEQGDYGRARPLLEEALAINRAVLGDRHPATASSVSSLAFVHRSLGDYARAEPLYQEVLAIDRAVFGDQHPSTATALNELGVHYSQQGDHTRAFPYYREALAISRAALGDRHPDTAQTMNNLGYLYSAVGDFAAAEPLLQESLEIRRAALGNRHPATAWSLSNLATAYELQGDYARAEPLYEEALAIRREVLGNRHPETARSLNNLGNVYTFQKAYVRAEPLYQEALAIHRAILGDDHLQTAVSLNNLGTLYSLQGDSARAEPLLDQTCRLTRRHVDLAAVAHSSRQQLVMTQSLRQYLYKYLSLATRLPSAVPTAWDHALAWKGAVLFQERARRAAAEDPALQPALAELQSTAARLAELALTPPEPSRVEAWRRRLVELSDRKEQIEGDLARRSAALRQAIQPATADTVRKGLPAGTVLVDFLEYWHWPVGPLELERRLLAFVVRRDAEPRLVSLGLEEPIAEAVRRWRADLGASPAAREAGQRLRELVWMPLEEAFGKTAPTRILISADGVLSQLPFAALPGRAPDTYLLEERPIATVPAPLLLPSLLAPFTAPRPAGSLLALGGVNYDGRDAAEAVPRATGPSAAAVRDAGVTFALLEGTRGEVVALEQLYRRVFGTAGMAVLQGGSATEAAVRQDAPRHRYLHLATHGFFAPARFRSALAPGDSPPRPVQTIGDAVTGHHPGLLSGLALAGANAPLPDDDGILTAEEVATLNLSGVELAVLSACETGLGLVAGGEGLLGLQRAFHASGARTVIASLWTVDDAATRALMERFYENLWIKKMGKLAALREAQLAMLHNAAPAAPGAGDARGLTLPDARPDSGRRSPALWAAFVLSGDWR